MGTTPIAPADTAVPDDPTDLGRRDYVVALKRTLKELKDDDVPGLAAGVAFKMFLSLFPSLFAAVAIFSIVTTPGEIAQMLDAATGVVPESAIKLLREPLRELAQTESGTAGFAAAVGIGTGVFAATGAAVSLMKALSRSYDVPETRKFVRQRAIGLALTLALLVALVAIALLLVVGPQLQEALIPNVPPPLAWVLATARFVLVLAVLVVLFAFVYWAGPNRERPAWVWMSPGALLGVVGWLLAAAGFTFYAQTAGTYNETYTGIAGVAVLLIWLQLSMLAILIGAEFNAEIERRRTLRLRLREGSGFAQPGAAALVPRPEIQAPGASPLPPSPPASSAPAVRTAGAVAAAVTAAAVCLGFARRRARR